MKATTLPLLVLAGLVPAACSDDEPTVTAAALTAVCVDDVTVVTDADWLCDEPRVVECSDWDGTRVTTIYVDPTTGTCADVDLVISDRGPYLVGDTTIVITDGDVELCSSLLTVVDTTPPLLTPVVHELHPSNHKMHDITPWDCLDVVDACDPDVAVWFTGASSDEPDDDIGDGNTSGDIVLVAPDHLQLRAERAGGSNGRVYTLDWEARDAAGNGASGTCEVIVPHDQGHGGGATRDADAYHVTFER